MKPLIAFYPKWFTDKFWSHVNKKGPVLVPELEKCWEWTMSTTLGGYGQMVCRSISPIPMYTHRISWVIENGKTDLHVLHKCDNRKCCRPSHLFEGTQSDNNRDRQRKGRTASGDRNGARTKRSRNSFVKNGGAGLRGDAHPNAKLTEAEVRRVVLLFDTGKFKKIELAGMFKVSATHIGRILSGKGRVGQ